MFIDIIGIPGDNHFIVIPIFDLATDNTAFCCPIQRRIIGSLLYKSIWHCRFEPVTEWGCVSSIFSYSVLWRYLRGTLSKNLTKTSCCYFSGVHMRNTPSIFSICTRIPISSIVPVRLSMERRNLVTNVLLSSG